MLRNKIFSTFNEVIMLGDSYSLADYDFFDTNRCFPDKGYAWIEKNLGLKKNNLLSNRWPIDDIKNLDMQLKSCCVIEKKYHWIEVAPSYIENHYFGLVHMERISFSFYFPAWMSLFLDDQNLLPMSSIYFFKKLSSLNFYEESIYQWLSESQKKVIVEFLSTIRGEWSDDAKIAHIMWESTLA